MTAIFNSKQNKTMKKYSKKEVLSALKSKNGIAKVTFRKQDGSVREMYASLRPHDLLPTKGNKHHKIDDLITVVDTSINEWRSFYISDIIELKKDVRPSYGAKIGKSLVKFDKRSKANKARSMYRNMKEFINENCM